ncbi:MAG: hypothetical protein JWP97_5731 [Labilithrix sp.]|nr:hypothetical protein [Labilithrix sp.]
MRRPGNKMPPSSVTRRMPAHAVVSRGRRLAASGALATAAAGLAVLAVHDLRWVEWSVLAGAGVLAASALGLSRKSVTAQVFSRGAAWVVFVPSAIGAFVTMVADTPEPALFGLAAGTGAALVLARPMLHTAEAHAGFAASRFRRWLLAGATASVATGLVTGLVGLDFVHRALAWSHSWAGAVGFSALTLGLFASALGVLRLRTWGILLGGLTSLATLAAAAAVGGPAGMALSLAAIPGLLFFVLPVLLARQERSREALQTRTRVAAFDDASLLPSRVRVADDAFAASADDHLASEPPRGRAQHVA